MRIKCPTNTADRKSAKMKRQENKEITVIYITSNANITGQHIDANSK